MNHDNNNTNDNHNLTTIFLGCDSIEIEINCMPVLFVGALKNIESKIGWFLIIFAKENHIVDKLAQLTLAKSVAKMGSWG